MEIVILKLWKKWLVVNQDAFPISAGYIKTSFYQKTKKNAKNL